MPIKVFVSLPMKNKSREAIITEQNALIQRASEKLGEPVMLVEAYFRELYSQKPLECLGENLKRMAHAEYIIFADGWQNARGCIAERFCAENYDIPILEL